MLLDTTLHRSAPSRPHVPTSPTKNRPSKTSTVLGQKACPVGVSGWRPGVEQCALPLCLAVASGGSLFCSS